MKKKLLILAAAGLMAAPLSAMAAANTSGTAVASGAAQTVTLVAGTNLDSLATGASVDISLSDKIGMSYAEDSALTTVGIATGHKASANYYYGNTGGGSIQTNTKSKGSDVTAANAVTAVGS